MHFCSLRLPLSTIRSAFPPHLAALRKLGSDPRCGSNPIAHRVRRKRQRLPPSLLIENASDRDPIRCESILPEAFPIKASDQPEVDQFGRHSDVSQGLSVRFSERSILPPQCMTVCPVRPSVVTRARSEEKPKVLRSSASVNTNGTAVETNEEAKMRYHSRPGSTVLWQAYNLPQIQSPDVRC